MATPVVMFAPNGQTGEIPADKVAAAQQSGFKKAFTMYSPDGQSGYIPEDRIQDAVKAGFKANAPDQPQGSHYWEALTNPVGSGGREQGLLGGALQVGGQAIKTIAQPFMHPVDTFNAAVEGEKNKSMLERLAPAVNPIAGAAAQLVKPAVEQYAADKQQGGNALAAENLAGNVIGTVEGGRLASAGVAKAAPIVGAQVAKISPTALKASGGDLLKVAARDANQVPVSLDNSQAAALNLMDWQKTTNLGPTVNKFLQRITKPNAPPLTYAEARKFYQVLGGLSADENLKMPPAIKRDLTQMVVGLKQDIGNAADQVGQAANYYQGLGNYALGKRLEGWYNFAKDTLGRETIKGIAKGAGLGAGGALGYEIYKHSQ